MWAHLVDPAAFPIKPAEEKFVNNLTDEKLRYQDCLKQAQRIMKKAALQNNSVLLCKLIEKRVVVPMDTLRDLISEGQYSIIDLMLNAGHDLLRCDYMKETAIDYAIRYHQWDILQLLLRNINGKELTSCFKSPMDQVIPLAKGGQWGTVSELLDPANPNCLKLRQETYEELLKLAAGQNTGAEDRIKWLLTLDYDKKKNVLTELYTIAFSRKNWSLVVYLLENGANVNAKHKDNSIWTFLKYSTVPEDTLKYITQMQQIADIKKECESYKMYLLEKSPKYRLGKGYLRIMSNKGRNKVSALEDLIKDFPSKITKANAGHELAKFRVNFETTFTQANDARDRQFKSAIKAILAFASLSAYGIYRCVKLRSLKFWKTRKELFIEKINETTAAPKLANKSKL